MNELTIKEITRIVMEQAKEKGFGVNPEEIDVAEKIALIHTEISGAFQAYRYKDMNKFKEELCDAIQRILHLCGIFNIDIEKEIIDKIGKNKKREWKWEEMNEKHT